MYKYKKSTVSASNSSNTHSIVASPLTCATSKYSLPHFIFTLWIRWSIQCFVSGKSLATCEKILICLEPVEWPYLWLCSPLRKSFPLFVWSKRNQKVAEVKGISWALRLSCYLYTPTTLVGKQKTLITDYYNINKVTMWYVCVYSIYNSPSTWRIIPVSR